MALPKRYLRFAVKLIFGLAVVGFVGWKIVHLLQENRTDELTITGNGILLLSIACLLVFLNWSAEALKWKLLMEPLKSMRFQEAFSGVLAGLSTGILTPNRLGNFIGRTALLQPEFRIKGTLLTLLANLSQFVTTIFFGLIGLMLLGGQYLEVPDLLLYVTGGVVLLLGVLIYLQPVLVDKKPFNYFFSGQIVEGIGFINDAPVALKMKVLTISALRYLIFVTQYVLIILAFYDSFYSVGLVAPVAVVYLLMTLIPSLFFGKLFVREAAALLVLSAVGIPDAVVLLTGFVLWLINIALPSLVGMAFLMRKK